MSNGVSRWVVNRDVIDVQYGAAVYDYCRTTRRFSRVYNFRQSDVVRLDVEAREASRCDAFVLLIRPGFSLQTERAIEW